MPGSAGLPSALERDHVHHQPNADSRLRALRRQSLCAGLPGALPMNRPLKAARQSLIDAPCCAVLLLFLALNGCRKSADEYLQRAHEAAYRKDPQRALREYRLALDAVDRLDTAEAPGARAR